MWQQQQLNTTKKSKSKPRHTPYSPNLPTIIEYWGTCAGTTRTVVVHPDQAPPPMQPRPIPSAVKAKGFGIIERECTDVGEADALSFASDSSQSEASHGVVVEYPQVTETTSLLGPRLVIQYYGATSTLILHPPTQHPAKFPVLDDIATPATLESGFHIPPSTLTSTLTSDSRLRARLQSEREHIARGRPWPLTRFLWWLFRPKIRRQYEPMSTFECWVMGLGCLLLVAVLGAAAWSYWGLGGVTLSGV